MLSPVNWTSPPDVMFFITNGLTLMVCLAYIVVSRRHGLRPLALKFDAIIGLCMACIATLLVIGDARGAVGEAGLMRFALTLGVCVVLIAQAAVILTSLVTTLRTGAMMKVSTGLITLVAYTYGIVWLAGPTLSRLAYSRWVAA